MKPWDKAKRQARRIGQTQSKAGKRRAVRTWADKCREALGVPTK